MIVAGTLSGQLHQRKTTLLMSMNFVAGAALDAYAPSVDFSGNGHDFIGYGYGASGGGYNIFNFVDQRVDNGTYHDYDGRHLPIAQAFVKPQIRFDSANLTNISSPGSQNGPILADAESHWIAPEVQAYPNYASQLAACLAFDRTPKIMNYSLVNPWSADPAGIVEYHNHDDDYESPPESESPPPGTVIHDTKRYWNTHDSWTAWHNRGFWSYYKQPALFNSDCLINAQYFKCMVSDSHEHFNWSDNNKNFRLVFDFIPSYDYLYETWKDTYLARDGNGDIIPRGIAPSSGQMVSNGQMTADRSDGVMFSIDYTSNGVKQLYSGSGAPIDPDDGSTQGSLHITFGSNSLTVNGTSRLPIRNNTRAKFRMDRINGIAYIYINEIPCGTIVTESIPNTFALRVEPAPAPTPENPIPTDEVYVNGNLQACTPLPVGVGQTVAAYSTHYTMPWSKLILFGPDKQFGGKIFNLSLFSIDS